MSCLITQGLALSCEFILGGLSRLAIGNRSELSAATSSAITMSGAAVMYEIEFSPNTGAFTNELTVSNGQKYVTQGISFQVGNKSTAVLAQAANLALGKFFAVAMDRAGTSFLLGRTGYGLQATVTSLNSGAAEGDFGGLGVTMTCGSVEYALKYTGVSLPGIASWV